jgi:hypothetical protein
LGRGHALITGILICALVFTFRLCAASSIAAPAGVDLVGEANSITYDNLKSVICREEIHRFKSEASGEHVRLLDTVTANISFESGNEHYSDIRQNSRKRRAISSLDGAWSQGELGTLLSQTLSMLKIRPVTFLRKEKVNGHGTRVYQFDVAAEVSPWDLVIEAQHFRIGYRTTLWASSETGDLLRIERASLDIPEGAHISQLQWTVNLKRVEVNGNNWLVPQAGEYSVLYSDINRRDWNEMTFTGYRRYGADIALRFDTVQ